MKPFVISALVILICFCDARAQMDTIYVDTTKAQDTILYLPKGFETSVVGVIDSVDYEKRLYQNPTVGLFKSMLIPGLGQIGNRQYIKAGIVIGLQSWLITSAVKHGRDASDLKAQFNESTDNNERNALYDQYLNSKDQRNKFTWFAVIVTFVSMFDAYSDAHLSGFPKVKKPDKNELQLNFAPTVDSGVYASVSYSF